jgi:hypothetical protein
MFPSADSNPLIVSNYGRAELLTKLCRWVLIRIGLAALVCLIIGVFFAAWQLNAMRPH